MENFSGTEKEESSILMYRRELEIAGAYKLKAASQCFVFTLGSESRLA